MFSEEEMYAVTEMFEELGYQVDEMICSLDQIDHFVIVLIPTGRSAMWTMNAINQAGPFSNIWHDTTRIINPVVKDGMVVVKMTEDRLVDAFNRCEPETKRTIVSSIIFSIYVELQLSHWIPAMCTCGLSEDVDKCMMLTTVGPFDNLNVKKIRNTNFVPGWNGCLVWGDLSQHNEPIMLCLDKFCITVVRPIGTNVTEKDFLENNTAFSCWKFNKGGDQIDARFVIHTSIPDGDETEMVLSLKVEDGWSVMRTKEYLICVIDVDDDHRWIMIPMEYVVELEWRVA